jgi:PAS domain S-box-containing protein
MSQPVDAAEQGPYPASLELFLDVADNVFVTLDPKGRVTLLNRHGCELLGYDEPEVLGKDWFEHFLPDSVRAEVRLAFDRLIAGEGYAAGRADCPVLCRDGSERMIAWHNTVLRLAEGAPIGTLSSGTDITEQGRAHRALRASRKELEDMRHAIDKAAIVAITDVSGRIFYVNDAFCQISGYGRGELIGQTHSLVNSALHPAPFFKDLWETIASGQVWRGEIRNQARDGRNYWVDTTIVPFLDEQEQPYQYMAIRTDITDRKGTEARLREQAALARLGEMASVVAHEVRNPLAGIGGALQVIARRIPQHRREYSIVRDILARIEVLDAKMEDLLQYARPRAPRIKSLDLGELIGAVVGQVREDPRLEGVEIIADTGSLACAADPSQLSGALLNLVLNAADATGQGGTVQVTVDVDDAGCRIGVVDDGPGIPDDLRERVLEPFFTTRHRGTGLGLAIVRRAIEAHGGTLEIECPESGGTIVRLALPHQVG